MTIKDKNIYGEEVFPTGIWDVNDCEKGLIQIRANGFQDIVYAVCEWGEARNITAEGGATALSQTKKMFEEVQEFVDAKTHEEAKDAIGDMLVVLIQMCRLRGYDLVECLEGAYNEIKDRKGTMIDGVFHKEQ